MGVNEKIVIFFEMEPPFRYKKNRTFASFYFRIQIFYLFL